MICQMGTVLSKGLKINCIQTSPTNEHTVFAICSIIAITTRTFPMGIAVAASLTKPLTFRFSKKQTYEE